MQATRERTRGAALRHSHVVLDELDTLGDVVFHLHELLLHEHRPDQLEDARVLLQDFQLLSTARDMDTVALALHCAWPGAE